MNNNCFSLKVSVFHGRQAPEEATLVGYGAIIEALQLTMPFPEQLALISDKRRSYSETNWKVFSSRTAFDDSLYKHLVFALKNEGVNLLFFKKLFDKLSEKEMMSLLQLEPTGQYSRKIWFLYEWLLQKQLDIKDLSIKNFVPLIDDKMQYAIEGTRSSRHRIINNLPGTIDFCPLLFKTEKLEAHINANVSGKKNAFLSSIHKDVLQRASSFLLLKDSKASFAIEGESPKSKRAARWGQAIGQAGTKDLSKEELIRLQQIVIENDRFINMGFREKGGFVGEHDRSSGEPLPEHISAKWDDLDKLLTGLLNTNDKLLNSDLDAVLMATIIAFGFIFIHPFEDGNGRIHRYLIHHVLAKKKFSQQGMIFPVSSSILDHLDDYSKVLENFSHPLLDFIDWEETTDHNVNVLNDTLDYYRYFDATKQAEFLYDCVHDTIENIIPDEVTYLTNYDEFKRYLDDEFEMPDKLVALLVRFLEQNAGKLSQRAMEKEFASLSDTEVEEIERKYVLVFS
ncbi:Fic family protein [Ancylomarina sp. 16SWW S1-10-2]|uniref:Fic family protein n=1 Tax=Ancylomarina sp. 16SWW S1-10-2 TaxID=2499681 RepID=UPI0012AE35CA|nr:Fic family protein [Ancylomarina sp. 16SWW S1-10-2]MRT92636.1 cell filamentation protein Fic [Ancylomarina sp. 16SWW S1-10-2]